MKKLSFVFALRRNQRYVPVAGVGLEHVSPVQKGILEDAFSPLSTGGGYLRCASIPVALKALREADAAEHYRRLALAAALCSGIDADEWAEADGCVTVEPIALLKGGFTG